MKTDNFTLGWAKKPYTQATFDRSAALLLRIIEDFDVDGFSFEEVQDLTFSSARRHRELQNFGSYGHRHIECLIFQGYVREIGAEEYALTDEGIIEGKRN